jgi:hypothetical protein
MGHPKHSPNHIVLLFVVGFAIVLMVRLMPQFQTNEIPVLRIAEDLDTLMDQSVMNENVADTINQDADTDVEASITSTHDTEHHKQPTWDAEDESDYIILLKKSCSGQVVRVVDKPQESVQYKAMQTVSYQFHNAEGGNNDEAVGKNVHRVDFWRKL